MLPILNERITPPEGPGNVPIVEGTGNLPNRFKSFWNIFNKVVATPTAIMAEFTILYKLIFS